MIVAPTRRRPHHPRHQRPALRRLRPSAGLLLGVQPDSRRVARPAAGRAAAGARTPALPGRLADALLRLHARRDRAAGRIAGRGHARQRHAVAGNGPQAGWGRGPSGMLSGGPEHRPARTPAAGAGLGVRTVEKLLAARRVRRLRHADLGRLHVPLAKVLPFVAAPTTCPPTGCASPPACAPSWRPRRRRPRSSPEPAWNGTGPRHAANHHPEPCGRLAGLSPGGPRLPAGRPAARGRALAGGGRCGRAICSRPSAAGQQRADAASDERGQPHPPQPVCPAPSWPWPSTRTLHSDPERHALLYRAIWRLAHEAPCATTRSTPTWHACSAWPPPCGATCTRCAPSCASARRGRRPGRALHVAWFEPDHHISRAANAAFFVQRFTQMRWAILTPAAVCAGTRARCRKARAPRAPMRRRPMRARRSGSPTTGTHSIRRA